MNKREELDYLRRYRSKQEFGWDFHTWETKQGCVLQLGQMRVYYGRCVDCSCLVTTRRSIEHGTRVGLTSGARWPDRCDLCRQAKKQAHDAKAKERMQELRAKRKAFRDEQFRKVGLL